MIVFRPYVPLRFSVEERSLSNMRFWLEDNNGNILPMERDWSVGIILYSLADKFNFFHLNSNTPVIEKDDRRKSSRRSS